MRNKKQIFMILLIIMILSTNISFADSKNKVYVIPIHGEINGATRNYVISNLKNIREEDNVGAIIFDIDTYGGLIDKAIEIKDEIIKTNIPTISYVNNKAESAGVLLTIASEKVVMNQNATIGSAETIPNTEKILSMWKSVLRDTAQLRNREELIIQAMADKTMIIPGLSDEGKLVNLTSKEAYEFGISDFTGNTYDEILKEFDIQNYNLLIKEEGFQVKLAKYISSPYISSSLLTLAFIGLIIEIISPGFGFGASFSILGFGLYFGGNILAGHSNWTSFILFITGFLLLVVELLVPGFGLPGISGIILVVVGLVMAMDSLGMAVFSITIATIASFILTVILLKLGFKSRALNDLILNTSIDRSSSEKADKEILGYKVRSLTSLRPSGFVDIDGKRVDVLSEDGFIEKGTLVKISKIEGSKIFVRRV